MTNYTTPRWNIEKPCRANGFKSGRPSAYQIQIHRYSDQLLTNELTHCNRSIEKLDTSCPSYRLDKRHYDVMIKCVNEEIEWRKENTK